MKAARVALPLAILLIGAAPARGTRTLYFGQSAESERWCGFTSRTARDAAIKDAVGDEVAAVTFAGTRVSKVIDQADPESGDWIAVDTYTLSGGMVRLERRIGLAATEIQVVKRGAARIGRPLRLKLVSARWPDGRSVAPNGWDDPQVPVTSNVEKFPFVALGRTMLRKGLTHLCQPVRATKR